MDHPVYVYSIRLTINKLLINQIFLYSVNRVKNDTGVIINISESDNNSNIIRIEGRKDGVELAKSVRYIEACY